MDQAFDRSLVHLPGAAGRFAGLLEWDGLSRLLEWTPLQPPRIELARGGRTIAPERFLSGDKSPVIDAGRLSLELAQGATLIVNGIDQMVPGVAALADELAGDLGVRTGINLYARWKADSGLPLHWDTHGVIVLQLAGRKSWTVHSPTRPLPVDGDRFEPPAPGAEPAWEGVLEDGDVLYLPRGYPHGASAVDGPSMHLTISLEEATGIGFVKWLLPRLQEESELRAPVPHAGGPAADAAWLAEMRGAVCAQLTDEMLAGYRAAWAAGPPARPVFTLPQFERAQPGTWDERTELRLASERAVRIVRERDRTARALFGSQTWPCAAATADALARLSSCAPLALGELERGLGPAHRAELRRLLALMLVSGVLFARPAED